MRHTDEDGFITFFPQWKNLNPHTQGRISVSSTKSDIGKLIFCLIVDGDLQKVKAELEAKHAPIISDIVERHGAHGTMQSIYLRDPDGNLVELSSYYLPKKLYEKSKLSISQNFRKKI